MAEPAFFTVLVNVSVRPVAPVAGIVRDVTVRSGFGVSGAVTVTVPDTAPLLLVSLSVPASSVAIAITRYVPGAVVDGTVSIGDFANLAANFNLPNTTWVKGNYNYDLITDISDFSQLAANFNTSVPADLPRSNSTAAAGLFSDTRIQDGAGRSELIDELV